MKKLITLAGYICLFAIVFAGRVWAQTISSDLTLTSVFRPTGLGILNKTVPNIILNDGYVLVVKGDSTPTIVKYNFENVKQWETQITDTAEMDGMIETLTIYPRVSKLVKLGDGSFIVTGVTLNGNEFAIQTFHFQMRLSDNGEKIWSKFTPLEDSIELTFGEALADNKYLLVTSELQKTVFTIYDADGNAVDQYRYDAAQVPANVDCLVDSQENLICVGSVTKNLTSGNLNYSQDAVHFVKISPQGALLFNHSYEQSFVSETAYKLLGVDAGYIISGKSLISPNAPTAAANGDLDAQTYKYYRDHTGSLLMKVDPDGKLLWRKYYATNGTELKDVIKLDDGFLAVGTFYRNSNNPSGDITDTSGCSSVQTFYPHQFWYLMAYFDENGEKRWIKVFGRLGTWFSDADCSQAGYDGGQLGNIYQRADNDFLAVGSDIVQFKFNNQDTLVSPTPTPAPSPSPAPIQSVTPTTIPAPTEFKVPSSMTTKRDLSSLNILQASGVSDRSKISAHTLVDDGYVIFFKYAGGSDDQKTTVVKYDFNHNLMWKKTVVSTFTHNSTADAWSVYPEFSHAITLNNGNIVAAGIKQTSDEFGSYYYLVQVKFDENGNQNWFQVQNVGSSFVLYSLAATNDSGYIITSMLGDKPTLTKYDSSGDVNVSYAYNESTLSFDGDTIVLDNGDYLSAGAMSSILKVGSGNYYKVYNIRVTQINSAGKIVKSYDYESIYVSEKPHKIILADDSYIIAGESEINANAAVDVKAGTLSSDTYNYYRDHTGSLLLKINADNGQIVWKKYYATNGSGWSDVIKTDRGYVTVGTLHRNYNYPSGDITNISGISEINRLFPYSYWYLMGFFDEDGNRKWIKVFSDSISDTKNYNSTDKKLRRIYDLKEGNLLGIGEQIVAMSIYNSPVSQSTTADKHLYRFWSKTFNSHFFTTSYDEALGVANNDANWQYEHVGYDVNDCTDANSFKVYRFWSDNYHGHFYTMSEQEKNSVIANDKNWRYEGEVFCVFTQDSGSGTKPVYRFWSDNFRHHFYTSDVAERDFTIKYDKNWRYEGEAWRIKGENYQASTTKKVKSALMASKMNYPADTAYTREIDQSVLDGKAKETSTAEATPEATIETAHLISSLPASESAAVALTEEHTESVDDRTLQAATPSHTEGQEQEISLTSDEMQTEEATATSEAEINV